jgi:glycosyltransferase involved in cell wall biosynthesis
MKISFITTVFNEEKTIANFFDSLLSQSKLPDEVCIVDGGSFDNTGSIIKKYESKFKKKKVVFKFFTKKGNRSVGRNEAIENTTGDIILCSDAGNELDRDWIKNIVKPFADKKTDVVAGYYTGKSKNVFQKCLIPYVLVMPDKVNSDNFLPATRSIAFKKTIWQKAGKFDEELSHNEDYVFAKKLETIGAKIIFAKDAVVHWIPRNTYREAFIMFYRFAFGDAEAGIFRSKVLFLLARYILALYLLFLCILYHSLSGAILFVLMFILYIVWSIQKNYKYVHNPKALYILPALQFTADIAVTIGTWIGIVKRLSNNFLLKLKSNKFLLFILASYVIFLLFTLDWGVPNAMHPFPNHMDEWHQLHAVGTTFKEGTPNAEGSANGTMFHFILSGFYAIPFVLLHIMDFSALRIDDFAMRERVFEIFRISTIIWGVLSILTLSKITNLLNASKKLGIVLFTVTPVWLMLSGYFKYDIGLMFWILLSLYFILRFGKEPTGRNFIIAAIPTALAFSVKVSALPLIIIYIFSYFWFMKSWIRKSKYLFLGIGVVIGTILLFGIPDTLFGKGNILFYLQDNLINVPKGASNVDVGQNHLLYLYTHLYPILFGHGLMILFISALVILGTLFYKAGLKNILKLYKVEIFLLFSLIVFATSLLSLEIFATGNRAMVLLPFFVIIIILSFKHIPQGNFRKLVPFFIAGVIILQMYEVFAWSYIKFTPSSQVVASDWIVKNIPKDSVIGIENVPIYQMLPHVIEKEFYYAQYNVKQKNTYTYKIIDGNSSSLPPLVVVTNGELESEFLKTSPKKSLMERLEKDKYKKIATFTPNVTFYQPLGNGFDFVHASLIASPATITILKKIIN